MEQSIDVYPEQKGLGGMWKRINQQGKMTTLLLFLPPALFLFTLFVILPLGEASIYSLYKWNGIGELDNFIGLKNYERVAGHSVFSSAVVNTLKIVGVSLFIQLPLAMICALCVYQKKWSNTVFRMMFFLPYILAEVVAGLIWRFIYDGNYGLISSFTEFFGLEPIFVLADRGLAFTAILVVIVWKYFGFHMMIFIAALQGISKDLIEAAKIDGASTLQTTLLIKIPLVRHAIVLSVFFSVLGALQLFDLIMPMTQGGPGHTSHSIVSYLYTFGISRMHIGFGSAIGVILFIACVIFAFIYQNTFMNNKAGGKS
ncbi:MULTISPECIES: carbohydrate ABC transporter permease [Aliagarivorans]|uniref:carbohydrate ABC transporter permease n=1 Tax=Aliagarivorans TaxID=882379 RepID=UPI00041EE47B|nr:MULTISPECIES: sugar ABC transporter permease [Aliagarivorans]